MPPPSLLTTTIRTGDSAWRSAASPFDVVEEAEVAGDDPGRPPGCAPRRRSRRRSSPSIPFAPRLARNSTSAAEAGRNASWSRIGMLEAV